MATSDIEKWLAEGDLTNDGRANEVVSLVSANPDIFEDVFICLESTNPVIRGHAADALEKIGRDYPDLYLPHIDSIITILNKDPIPMVQWHLAMLLGHLAIYTEYIESFIPVLVSLLEKKQLFTQSWAMTSLAIIAVLAPEYQGQSVDAITKHENAPSAALRNRVKKALNVLVGGEPFPKGWVKSSLVEKALKRKD
jgi:hypothetical protein